MTLRVSAFAVGAVSVIRIVKVLLPVWLALSVTVMAIASLTLLSPVLWFWLVPVGS